MLLWTVLGTVGIVLLVAGASVLGWIVSDVPGAMVGGLLTAGCALVLAAMDALSELEPGQDA